MAHWLLPLLLVPVQVGPQPLHWCSPRARLHPRLLLLAPTAGAAGAPYPTRSCCWQDFSLRARGGPGPEIHFHESHRTASMADNVANDVGSSPLASASASPTSSDPFSLGFDFFKNPVMSVTLLNTLASLAHFSSLIFFCATASMFVVHPQHVG